MGRGDALAAALLGLLVLTGPAAYADLYVANSYSNNVGVSIGGSGCGFFNGTVPVGARPVGVAVSPSGERAYVTNMGDGTVSVIDTATAAVTATVQVGGSPFGPMDAAVHPSGSRVYVISNNRVVVIDSATLAITATVFVAGFANDVAVHPDGTRVYVVTAAGYLAIIDTASNSLTTQIPVGTNLRGVAVNPAGSRLYVTDFGVVGSLAVIDTASNAVLTAVLVEGVPTAVAVDLDGSRVYVANNLNQSGVPFPGKLTLIDGATNTVLIAQQIGANPYGVAVDRSYVYVTVDDGGGSQGYIGHLWVLDASTGAFVQEQPVGAIPAGVATFVNPLPPLPTTVRVTGIEVTQGIQDLAHNVTLVGGRRTFVRVHVQATGPAVPGVTATLFGVGVQCTTAYCYGKPLGSLVPVNNVGTRLTVWPLPKRLNLNHGFLFELPWSWSNGGALQLHAMLHTDPGPPPATCPTNAPSASAAFDAPTTLQIQFIRAAYDVAGPPPIPPPAASVCPSLPPGRQCVETTVADQNQSESWMRRAFPLSNLDSGRDWGFYDAELGTRVDRSDPECNDLKTASADDRNMCAHRFLTTRPALLDAAASADGAYALIPQHPAGTFFTRGACCTSSRIGAGPSQGASYGYYTTHEIGHLLGRQHPVKSAAACGHSATDPNYPHEFALIHPLLPFDPQTGLAGFDAGDSALSPPSPRTYLGSFTSNDVMSYCNPPTQWISDYTYMNVYNTLRGMSPAGLTSSVGALDPSGAVAPQASARQTSAPQSGDWLMVLGQITPALATPAYIQARRVDRVVLVPDRTPGNHSIRLTGAGGVVLADYPFAPEALADAETTGGSSPALGFAHVVPFVAGTTEIRIVDVAGGERVLGVKAVSPNPPVIGDVALQGVPDPATGLVTVGWTASDPDGDPLRFDIFVTRGAASPQPLMLGLSGTSAQIETAALGGGDVQLRVTATDGVQSAFGDTQTFNLPNRPPRTRILTPGDGTTVHLGQLVNLEGQATDPQDGLIPETGLAWSIPGRSLGPGSRLSITDLPTGSNAVTLTATNTLGLTNATTITVVVKNDPNPPGPTLTVGPGKIGWHVAAGASQAQTSEIAIGNSGSGTLEFTAQSSAPWLALNPSAGTAPASIALTADPGGLADGTTAEASVTVTAVGIVGQAITIPVTLSTGNTFVVGPSTPAPVDQCPNDPDKTQPGACGCGVPDADAGQACSTALPGVCSAGVTVCGGGSASCVASQQPSVERCDGLDNDCSGTADEGNPGGGGSCATGLPGVCGAGTLICANGGLTCQQTTQPGLEICGNNVDEDCDGVDLACPPPPPPTVDACAPTTVLDAFNRTDGSVGSNWRGLTGTSFYRIGANRLDVQAGGPLYWDPLVLGANQAAFVTLSTVAPQSPSQGVLLKVQGGSVPEAGAIAVVYDAVARAVRVSTLRVGAPIWTPYGQAGVRFEDGDKLGACATAKGEVRVYKNDSLVKTVTLNAADQRFFNPKGGKVGLWSVLAAKAFLDDFGGATVAP